MRKLLYLAVMGLLVGCGSGAESTTTEPKIKEVSVDAAKKKEIVEYLQSDAEPTIKDVIFKQDNHLGIAVLDDGSSRDGFAEYVCTVLKDDYQVDGVRVTVYDIMQLVNDDKWVEIGKSNCQ